MPATHPPDIDVRHGTAGGGGFLRGKRLLRKNVTSECEEEIRNILAGHNRYPLDVVGQQKGEGWGSLNSLMTV